MGLTLHYTLDGGTRPLPEVRQIIATLRRKALALPFVSVTDLIDLQDDECRFDRSNHGDPHAWLKVQMIRFLLPSESETPVAGELHPLHTVAFTIDLRRGGGGRKGEQTLF